MMNRTIEQWGVGTFLACVGKEELHSLTLLGPASRVLNEVEKKEEVKIRAGGEF